MFAVLNSCRHYACTNVTLSSAFLSSGEIDVVFLMLFRQQTGALLNSCSSCSLSPLNSVCFLRAFLSVFGHLPGQFLATNTSQVMYFIMWPQYCRSAGFNSKLVTFTSKCE